MGIPSHVETLPVQYRLLKGLGNRHIIPRLDRCIRPVPAETRLTRLVTLQTTGHQAVRNTARIDHSPRRGLKRPHVTHRSGRSCQTILRPHLRCGGRLGTYGTSRFRSRPRFSRGCPATEDVPRGRLEQAADGNRRRGRQRDSCAVFTKTHQHTTYLVVIKLCFKGFITSFCQHLCGFFLAESE